MNSVTLLGRLVKDPEVRYTNTGKCVAGFTLAVNRPFKNEEGQQEADFINCIVFNKSAETIGNYVHKGQRLLLEGRMQTRSYDAKGGSRRYVTEVIVNHFEFIEQKKDSNSGGFDDFGAPFDEKVPF